jgi:hypothetical protein
MDELEYEAGSDVQIASAIARYTRQSSDVVGTGLETVLNGGKDRCGIRMG